MELRSAVAAIEPGPGTPVIVGEHAAILEIFLEDELNGTVKSVDLGGLRTIVTGQDTDIEDDLEDARPGRVQGGQRRRC